MEDVVTLKCSVCGSYKTTESFSKEVGRARGFSYTCKSCVREYTQRRNNSYEGVIKQAYNHQVQNSKKRGHPPPDYTIEQLITYCESHGYKDLYNNYLISCRDIKLRPSVDRLDSTIGYTLENIELVTWEVNNKRANEERLLGKGSQSNFCQPVVRISNEGAEVLYHSMAEAERQNNIGNRDGQRLTNYFRIKGKKCGGFRWRKVDKIIED